MSRLGRFLHFIDFYKELSCLKNVTEKKSFVTIHLRCLEHGYAQPYPQQMWIRTGAVETRPSISRESNTVR